MCLVEDFWQFHPEGDQFADIEETAIIDFLRTGTPKGKAIVLPFQQIAQTVECCGLTWNSVIVFGDGIPDALRGFFPNNCARTARDRNSAAGISDQKFSGL